MNKKMAAWPVAITALVCMGQLRAHHSISLFDISTPVWVKGTVVRYAPINPHTMIALEERGEDGRVQRWTVEGPILSRLNRMGLDKDFLKIGDVIEVCGFALKEEVVSRRSSEDTDGLSPPFVHGHVLVMPDGQMQSWGPYGKLDNCVRPDDQRQAWLDLLRRDPLAREFWCDRWRASIPTRATSRALADEIKSLMAVPCD